MAELGSSDEKVRRCTVVKIEQSVGGFNSAVKSKISNMDAMDESQLSPQWTSRSPCPQPLDDLLNGLTPDSSPTPTLTKPKRLDPTNDNIICGKKFGSSGYMISETISLPFEDKSKLKRSETFRKQFDDFKEKDKYRESDLLCNSRKSRYIFLSQIYLIFHISITICLIGYKGLF